MKLKATALVSIGLLATVGTASAQSKLQLYGVFDVGSFYISNGSNANVGYIPSQQKGSAKFKTVKDGGLGQSNWGFRGTEELGDGYKVTFQLQGNINTETGALGGPNSSSTISEFNQIATVGVAGRFGEFKMGRQISPMYWAMASTDARGARYFGSALTALVGLNSASGAFIGNNSNAAFGSIYNDNAFSYTSPTWKNLTLNLVYAAGNTGSSLRANSQQTATLLYNADGLKLSALLYNGYGNNLPAATALYTAKLGNAAAAQAAVAKAGFSPTANTNRLYSLGALYNWKTYTVSGAVYRAENPAKVIVPNGSASLDMWTIAGGWKALPNVNLTAGYYQINDRTNQGNRASQFGFGLDYNLSKRTMLYAEGAYIRNKGANMNLSPVYGVPVVANQNVHAWMAGIRHSF